MWIILTWSEMDHSRGPTGNRILDALPRRDASAVLAKLTKVHLIAGQPVSHRGRPYPAIFFPIDCTLSQMLYLEGDLQIELASIGREGLHGSLTAFGSERAVFDSLCSIEGEAYQLPAKTFAALSGPSTHLRAEALRYHATMMAVFSKLSICNRFHSPVQRCARWLLIACERTNGDTFEITHEFFARLLGVQRSAVSLAMGKLQSCGAISHRRGRVTITKRRTLESFACECYRWMIAEIQW